MDAPLSQYLRSERGAIAYQAFGEGTRSLVWTGPPIMSIATRWDRPANIRLWEFMSSLGRVTLFDYRGFGLSEHVDLERVADLDELLFDLTAIVRDVAGPPVVLIGTGASAPAAIAFTAENADAVEKLVLLNPANRWDPGVAAPDIESIVVSARERWGTGEVLSRTQAHEDPDLRLAALTEQMSATPEVAAAYVRAMRTRDVSHLLGQIAVPTLAVHTGDVVHVTPAMVEQVASAIPRAAYISRPSSLFNWGEWDSDLKRFITGDPTATLGRRELAAILFTDVVGSTVHAAQIGDAKWREQLALLDAFVAAEAGTHQGRLVKQTGDGHLIEFGRPADALSCAERLVSAGPDVGIRLRVGLHFGEVERRPGGDIGGIAVHLAARIASEAAGSEVLVSRTVAEVTAGDGRRYEGRGFPQLKGVPGEWQVFRLVTM